MRKSLSVVFLFFLLSSNVYAFDKDRDVRDIPIKERFFLGLSAGFSYSSFETSVVLSPSFGFRFSNRFMAAVTGTYQYYNNRFLLQSFNTHIYGPGFFARVLIMPWLFVHGEFESLNMDTRDHQTHGYHRHWEYNYLLGPGYRAQVGRNAFFNIMILYNFNTESTIYFQNPIFRFNFEIGL